MKRERILVAGAGAIGSVLGGFLRRAGHTVALLGRAAQIEAVARDGLHIDGLWGEHHVDGFESATVASELHGTYDAVLITTKAYDTRGIVEAVLPCVDAHGVMVSMQNGLGNIEVIEELAGAERALGARVIFGATLLRPGHVRVTVFADPNAMGTLRPGLYPRRDELARHWAQVLDSAGIPTVYTDRLQAVLWAKVFYNAALNPLSALLGLHYGALPAHPDTRALMDAVIEEAFSVAVAEGVELPWSSAAAYRNEFYERLVPVTCDHRASMLHDLERGHQTEIDAINGQVWRRALAHGLQAPFNEMLTRLVRVRSQVPGGGGLAGS